ncbi:hypothetical protein MUG94_07075 [Arthrobacter gengyunqii]|uniref:Uncharacterized protein n=1 Tax=Arthrobacter gengyunqii TaxID=2886940 RepID=A0A9X1M3U1_9MICC|nr:hypothetical protein [Arthrobacter gengyunqii]MCC3270300.1 hypothetical protein [Arthrobacter gengyunqii]UOY97496.1 hypothetical protein MUG94_07075 [Arthrobacter gengyunqii]
MDSIQLWHITVLVIVVLIVAAIAGLVHFVRKNSPGRRSNHGTLPQQEPPA